MAFGDLQVYEKFFRKIRERQGDVRKALTEGVVADFTTFKEQRARLRELEDMEQVLKDLLEKAERDE